MAGYANTAAVQLIVQPPTFIDVGAGNARAAIPTALVTTLRDGGSQVFVGCYVAHKINIEQRALWDIEQAQVAQVDAGAALPPLLAQACATFGVPAPASVSYDNRSRPADLLASFYNAINRQRICACLRLLGKPAQQLRPVRGRLRRHRRRPAADRAADQLPGRGRQLVHRHSNRADRHARRRQPADLRRLLHRARLECSAGWLASVPREIAPVPNNPPVAPLLARDCE